MPNLKQLTCTVEWTGSNLALQEHQTTYADGYVETYIAIPSTPIPFSVHLKSNGYIAPGLAMFVYMDGVYQCNRNRHNLRIPDENTTRRQTEVDFRVRQKEELLADGTFQGKQWKFEKVNIVPDAGVEDRHQAPHDGEYVGTIEVVVLRCGPSDPAGSPTTPLKSSKNSKKIKSSFFEHGSDSEDISTWFDGAGDTKPKKTIERKLLPFSLDGSYDPGSPKNTAWDNWDAPSSPVERTKEDTKNSAQDNWGAAPSAAEQTKSASEDAAWGNWDAPASSVGKNKAGASDSWDNPPPAREEEKPTAWEAWDNPPAAKAESKTGSWGAWDNPSSPKEKPKMGKIKMLNETEGIMHPSTSNEPIKNARHGSKRSVSRDNFRSDWKVDGSERGRSRQPRSKTNSPTSPTMKIRGGGPGSYTVGSPGGGRTSPTVVINIAAGPPPPRDWMAEAKAEKEGKGKAGTYKPPTPPVANDPWTMNIPVDDYSKEAENHTAGSNWDWGAANNEQKKDESGSQVPGGWEDWNEQTEGKDDRTNSNDNWGTTNAQNKSNEDWGATADKKTYDDWDNTGGGDDWNVTNDDAQKNDDSWGNDNKDTHQNDNWGNDNNDTAKQDDAWDAGNGDNDKKNDDNWGNKNQQFESWDNTNTRDFDEPNKENEKEKETEKEKEKKKPVFSFGSPKGKKEKKQSTFGFGNTKVKNQSPKDSKDAKDELKAEAQIKAESVKSNKQNANAGRAKSPSKKGSSDTLTPDGKAVPGSWSPKAQSRKETSKAGGPTTAKPPSVFSLSSPPQPKPYWSMWKGVDKFEEPIEEEDPPVHETLDSPLYSVPSEVAKRNNTSHQVRPGKPAAYAHKTGTPKYMDTQENPYAAFVFMYRDKEIIEAMLETTIDEPEEVEKQRLVSLSKDELVEELMKMKEKEKLSGQENGPKNSGSDKEWEKSSMKSKKFDSTKVTTAGVVTEWLNKTNAAEKREIDNAETTDKDQGGEAWGFGGNANDNGKSNNGGWSFGGSGKKNKMQKKREDEKKDDNGWGADGRGDIWGNGGARDDWGNEKKDDKKTDEKKDDGKKTSGNDNGGVFSSWW